LTDSSTLQIANDPKLIFLIPEQVVFKMDLEIREFNFLKSQYPADTTKSLHYVFGLKLIFFGLVRPRTIKFFHSLLEPEQL